MAPKIVPAIERLFPMVTADGDCWRFTGALNSGGYGVIGRGGRGAGNALVHRLTYEFFIGDIPEGLDIDHLCRNRWCCNPWHLDPVTRIVNVARGLRATGYGPRERTHCAQGHDFTPDNTWTRPNGARRCKACERHQSENRKSRKREAA